MKDNAESCDAEADENEPYKYIKNNLQIEEY